MSRKETLSSRERIIRTLNRQSVDRLPIDLGMYTASSISAFAYWHLRKHLGLSTDQIWIPDVVQVTAKVDEDIRRRFHIDCIMLEPKWPAVWRWNPRGEYQFWMPATMDLQRDATGAWRTSQGERTMQMPDGGFFFDGAWISNWGKLDEDAAIAMYAAAAERIYKETPYATSYGGYAYGSGMDCYFDGFDQAMQMIEDPEGVHRENKARLEHAISRAAKVIRAMGKYVQMISVSNDMGMQSGPMCRPSMMEEFVFPYYKQFCSFIHQNSDLKVFMHNCGSIRAYLPGLIDAGIDVINPVQISAADMDPAALKRNFGDKIIFWGGGCDTQNVLGTATPEQVRQNVRGLIDIFKPGGGFVFNQVHNIMGDVPPENVVAMLDAAYEGSFYAKQR